MRIGSLNRANELTLALTASGGQPRYSKRSSCSCVHTRCNDQVLPKLTRTRATMFATDRNYSLCDTMLLNSWPHLRMRSANHSTCGSFDRHRLEDIRRPRSSNELIQSVNSSPSAIGRNVRPLRFELKWLQTQMTKQQRSAPSRICVVSCRFSPFQKLCHTQKHHESRSPQ